MGLCSGVKQQVNTNTANVYQMWVQPKYRGLGVGTALIKCIQSWAAANNAKKLALAVTISNVDAVSLYQSVGFRPIGAVEPLRPGSELKTQLMEIHFGFHFCATCGCMAYWRLIELGKDGKRAIAVNLRLADIETNSKIPMRRFDGLESFEGLPDDWLCVVDLWP